MNGEKAKAAEPSFGVMNEMFSGILKKRDRVIFDMVSFSLSGYQDSNLGPPAPKAGALTGLRYTPSV